MRDTSLSELMEQFGDDDELDVDVEQVVEPEQEQEHRPVPSTSPVFQVDLSNWVNKERIIETCYQLFVVEPSRAGVTLPFNIPKIVYRVRTTYDRWITYEKVKSILDEFVGHRFGDYQLVCRDGLYELINNPAVPEYRDYFLIKKDMTERIRFEATEIDALLVSPRGGVMLIAEEVDAAGFSPDGIVPIDDIPDELRELVLRVGDNRGHVVERSNERFEQSNEQFEQSNEQFEQSNEQNEQSNEQFEQSNEQSEQASEQNEQSNEQSEQSNEQLNEQVMA